MSSSPIKDESTVYPSHHDVLCGRGGNIYLHPGNKRYREWVRERKEAYNLAEKKEKKTIVASEIVNLVRSLDPPGRFLQRKDTKSSSWWEISERKAIQKVSQALREGAPAIRAEAKEKQNKALHIQRLQTLPPTPPCKIAYGNTPIIHYYSAPPHSISELRPNDSELLGRLDNVETMLQCLLQNQEKQTTAGSHCASNDTCAPTNSAQTTNEKQVAEKADDFLSKETLLTEIENLRDEVAKMRESSTKRQTPIKIEDQSIKKSRMQYESILYHSPTRPPRPY